MLLMHLKDNLLEHLDTEYVGLLHYRTRLALTDAMYEKDFCEWVFTINIQKHTQLI